MYSLLVRGCLAHRVAAVSLSAVLVLAIPCVARGQDGSQDFEFKELGDSLSARGEGFRSEVVSTDPVLTIVSFLHQELSHVVHDWDSATVLELRRPLYYSDQTLPAEVIATDLSGKEHYAMEADFGNRPSVLWPIGDVLQNPALDRSRRLKSGEVGVYGTLTLSGTELYAPIQVCVVNGDSCGQPGAFVLRIRSAHSLDRIDWRIFERHEATSTMLEQGAKNVSILPGQTFTIRIPPGPSAELSVDLNASEAGKPDIIVRSFSLFRTASEP